MKSEIGEPSQLLLADDNIRVEELNGRVYTVLVARHITRDSLALALQTIWSSPRWRQPWGLVIDLQNATYDNDLRKHEMPPANLRAVGTAIVTSKQMYRIVIKSINLGLKMFSNYELSAHDHFADAVRSQRQAVERAQAK